MKSKLMMKLGIVFIYICAFAFTKEHIMHNKQMPVKSMILNDVDKIALKKVTFFKAEKEKINNYLKLGLELDVVQNGSRECVDGETELTLTMNDSYGDSWNGNTFCINDDCATLDGVNDDGSTGTATFCVDMTAANYWTCGGGSWQSEVSWTLTGDGVDETGGAPSNGCIGYDCDGGGEECDEGLGAYSYACDGGSWQSEVSWMLNDAGSNEVAAGGAPSTGDLCLSGGAYTLYMFDSFGDGWNGNTFSISDADGNTLASCGLDSGFDGSCDFSLGIDPFCGDGVCNGDETADSCPDDCEDEGNDCEAGETELTLTMNDSYGDGWNGNTFCINDDCATLDSGSDGIVLFCVDMDAANSVICGGGSWQSEVSWTLTGDGVDLSGGAPFGPECLGDCEGGGGECDEGLGAYLYACGGGSWESEVSWTLNDAGSNEVAAGGAPSAGDLCLAGGTYTLYMFDSYGDGWNGNTFSISDADGNTLASCGLDSGSDGFCEFNLGSDPFCGDGECNGDETVDSCPFDCADPDVYLSFSNVNPIAGTVDIHVESVQEIAGFQFTVTDEPDVITFTDVYGGLAGDAAFELSLNGEDGIVIGFSLVGAIIAPNEGSLLTLSFTGDEDTELCITEAVVADISGNPISVGVGDCVSTEMAILPGDVNFDGEINVIDIVNIVNFILETATPSNDEALAADMNGDGEINVIDIVNIVNYILEGDGLLRGSVINSSKVLIGNETLTIKTDALIASAQLELSGNYSFASTELLGGYTLYRNDNKVVIVNLTGMESTDNLAIHYQGQINSVEGLVVDWQGNGTLTEEVILPETFKVQSAYPNPFNPVTSLVYELPEAADVKIVVYNTVGKQVAELVNDMQDVGNYSISWDAYNQPSGIYFLSFKAGHFQHTEKVLLLK